MTTADSDAAETTARRSPGRPRVPFDRIVTTALHIVDEQGVDALSMRTLAHRLDTGTAVLYRAVANRAELIAHTVDWVLGEVDIADDEIGDDWQRACIAAAEAIFSVLHRHPGIAPLLIAQVPIGPHSLALRERVLAMLLAHGFSPKSAALAYATIARYAIGFAAQLHGHSTAATIAPATLTTLYRQLDPGQFPATIAVADHLPTQTLESEFHFGLRLLVAGLAPLRCGAGHPNSDTL
ncbi:transcriptional regulator, TetR family [Nocardia amikacinitolerans]|uniref:TetR/AcrR family transcriptional regulator n=1 Tax=Nocardia amikacinitolerans TaxID=756689 RepID=UPI0008378A2A|nr:TetR/AcrR family transcriptional regulator [Nocardia amikacinitolerans]MCP2315986.1 transcriptional regulator, TetR family [Nocardia amikacinitolerans]